MNSVALPFLLLLLSSGARAMRTLHIANTISPPSRIYVFTQPIGGYLTAADAVSTTPISIASSPTTLFFALSYFDSLCKVTIDARFELRVCCDLHQARPHLNRQCL